MRGNPDAIDTSTQVTECSCEEKVDIMSSWRGLICKWCDREGTIDMYLKYKPSHFNTIIQQLLLMYITYPNNPSMKALKECASPKHFLPS